MKHAVLWSFTIGTPEKGKNTFNAVYSKHIKTYFSDCFDPSTARSLHAVIFVSCSIASKCQLLPPEVCMSTSTHASRGDFGHHFAAALTLAPAPLLSSSLSSISMDTPSTSVSKYFTFDIKDTLSPQSS